jgi:hypothetical protein
VSSIARKIPLLACHLPVSSLASLDTSSHCIESISQRLPWNSTLRLRWIDMDKDPEQHRPWLVSYKVVYINKLLHFDGPTCSEDRQPHHTIPKASRPVLTHKGYPKGDPRIESSRPAAPIPPIFATVTEVELTRDNPYHKHVLLKKTRLELKRRRHGRWQQR